jgi:hypothetical protein
MALARWPTSSAVSSSAPLARLGVGHAGQHRQQRDVVGHVEERDQVGRLEHEADAVAAQRAQVADLPAIVVDHSRPASCARAVGSITAPRHLSSVLLPEPEGPISPPPRRAPPTMLTPFSASTAVSPLP